MAGRARFPGKPTKPTNGGRLRVSYQETTRQTEETDYSKIAAQTATNLKAFRALFGSSGESEEEFAGFRVKEIADMKSNCGKKLSEINRTVQTLQTELIAASRAYNFSSDDERSFHVPTLKPRSNGHSSKATNSASVTQNEDEEEFVGFSDEDPLRESLRSKSLQLARRASTSAVVSSNGNKSTDDASVSNGHIPAANTTTAPLGRGSRIKTPTYKSAAAVTNNEKIEKAETRGKARSSVGQTKKSATRGRKRNSASQSSESDIPKLGNPIVLPRDFENFRRVKGPKMKQLESFDEPVPSLPHLRLNTHGNGGVLNSEILTVKDSSHIPKLADGALRSGKFIIEDEVSTEEEDLNDSNELTDEEIMLLDRQDGQVREGRVREAMIRSMCPIDLDDVEQFGFPVFVDGNTGSLPHKPLCFLCGSAGIEQLIFCSTCCEPYHPFCTGDDSLLSAFVSRIVPKSKTLSNNSQADLPIQDILKGPIPVYYSGAPSPSKAHTICSDNSRLSSLLTPPLTPLPLHLLEEDLEKEKELELWEMLQNWTCSRCVECSHCHQHDRQGSGTKNEFLKCSQCRLSYHTGCVKKGTWKKDLSEKWVCDNCCKCRSCGKKVERRLAVTTACCYKLDLTQDNSTTMLLCVNCFRQREKGSFCPICQMTYEDNDFETRMMECGKCEKWVHAKCENISEEQYQILSNLPESIEFICRMCDSSGTTFWRQAIQMEMSNGCEAVFRIFQKKAISTYRKKRILVSDLANQPAQLDTDLKPKVVCDIFSSKPDKTTGFGDIDFKENSHPTKSRSEASNVPEKVRRLSLEVLTNKHGGSGDLLQVIKIEETTPTKKCGETSGGPTQSRTQADFSPSKRIDSVLDSVSKTVNQEFTSVLAIYKATIQALQNSDEDDVPDLHLLEHFESAVKEVFPWFDVHEIENSSLTQDFAKLIKTQSLTKVTNLAQPISATKREDISDKYFRPIQSDTRCYVNPFQDVFWDSKITADSRRCSFCQEFGDFPPTFCGRLLWAGPSEWVHVNCALWSSEVWEENDGALQQVGGALTRSRISTCYICQKTGASVACCFQSCRKSFHFPCALNNNCMLLEDKSVFCETHAKKAKGNLQHDMQVLRQVYINTDWLRKKEKLIISSDIRVFIGSLRVDRLGRIVPISVDNTSSETTLIPLGYKCSRLFWSNTNPMEKMRYDFSTAVSKSKERHFRNQKQDINIVLDHSKSSAQLGRKRDQVTAFQNWVDSSARYIDEYNEEWIAPCPLNFNDCEDNSGSDADEEDNTQIEIDDSELIGPDVLVENDSLSSAQVIPETIFEDEANLFGDYLTEDAITHLQSCAQDFIGLDDAEWPIGIQSEPGSDSSSQTSTLVSDDENMDDKIASLALEEPGCQLDVSIFQVDGAYDDSSSSSSISISHRSDTESDSDSESDDYGNSHPSGSPRKSTLLMVEPIIRRGRGRPSKISLNVSNSSLMDCSTSNSQTPKKSKPEGTSNEEKVLSNGNRTLRSREKQPTINMKQPDVICSQCKKSLPAGTSMKRHLRWCKRKKSTAVSDKPTDVTGLAQSLTPSTIGAKRGRGRPPKVKLIEKLTDSADWRESDFNPQSESGASTTKPRRPSSPRISENVTAIKTSKPRYEKKSHVTSELNPEVLNNDNPVTCTKCKNTYRTGLSYKNHIPSCYTFSSSDEEVELKQTGSSSSTVLVSQDAETQSTNCENRATDEDTTTEEEDDERFGTEILPLVNDTSPRKSSLFQTARDLRSNNLGLDMKSKHSIQNSHSLIEISTSSVTTKTTATKADDQSLHFDLGSPDAAQTQKQLIIETHNSNANYSVSSQAPFGNDEQSRLQEILTNLQQNMDFTIKVNQCSPPFSGEVLTMQASASLEQNQIRNHCVAASAKLDQSQQSISSTSASVILPGQHEVILNQNCVNPPPANTKQQITTRPAQTNELNTLNTFQFQDSTKPVVLTQQIGSDVQLVPSKALNQPGVAHPVSNVAAHSQHIQQTAAVTLQDSNGQLVTVQIPINQPQFQVPYGYVQQQKQPSNALHGQENLSATGCAYQQIQEIQYQQFQQQQLTALTIHHQLQEAAAVHNRKQHQSVLKQQQQQALIEQQRGVLIRKQQHEDSTIRQQQQAMLQQQQHQALIQHQQAIQHQTSQLLVAQPTQHSIIHEQQQGSIFPALGFNLQPNPYQNNFNSSQNQSTGQSLTFVVVQHGDSIQHLQQQHFPLQVNPQIPNVVAPPSHGLQNAYRASTVGVLMSGTGNHAEYVARGPCSVQNDQNRLHVSENTQKLPIPTVQYTNHSNPGALALEPLALNSVDACPVKRARSAKVRAQLASLVTERQQLQGLLHHKTASPRGSGVLPRLLPATIATAPSASTNHITVVPCQLPSVVTTSSNLASLQTTEKTPLTHNPNIAVVHPLQKMSDQILQLESSFTQGQANPNIVSENLRRSNFGAQAANSVNSTELLPDMKSCSNVCQAGESLPESLGTDSILCDVAGAEKSHPEPLKVPTEDRAEQTEELKSKAVKHLPDDQPMIANPNPNSVETPETTSSNNKRKFEEVEPTPSPANGPSSPNKIKIILKRQESADHYSVTYNNRKSENQASGTMRSLKIKGKITSGEHAGETTDVVVEPIIHTIPIPDPDAAEESNRTIAEDDEQDKKCVKSFETSVVLPVSSQSQKPMRLTHRAVIVYVVKVNDEVIYRSGDVRSIWSNIFEIVQGIRLDHKLPPLAYPGTNISLPENKRETVTGFNQLGLTHRAVQFLMEQLPGVKAASNKHIFKFHQSQGASNEDAAIIENPTGCSRTEGYSNRKPFDMFGWLASKHRQPLVLDSNSRSLDMTKSVDLPVAMKFRNLSKNGAKHLNVYWSAIHGRGLFTTKDIEHGDMIIEYAGEVIRSPVCELREKYYESRGIGCYMFRIDDNYVVDATLKGNAARFINHSCEPNCHSKIMEILGQKHIIIIAMRRILSGEELTYDYKFPYEDVKIACTCGANKCRKFLN